MSWVPTAGGISGALAAVVVAVLLLRWMCCATSRSVWWSKISSFISGWRRSREHPPEMESEFDRLKREFFSLYNQHYSKLQKSIKKLRGIIKTFEGEFKNATKGSRDGAIAGIAGGATVIAGVVLAPFTLGVSTALTVAGLTVATGGAVGGGVWNIKKFNQQCNLRKTVEEELKKFENTVSPITKIMEKLNQCTVDILMNFTKRSEPNFGLLSKLFVSSSELIRVVRIDDIGELAAQMSKTVRVTAALSGVFAGIGLIFDILSFLEDGKALSDMNRLAGTRAHISESEIRSKAGTFIIKMRKVISDLENVMAEIERTKNKPSNPRIKLQTALKGTSDPGSPAPRAIRMTKNSRKHAFKEVDKN